VAQGERVALCAPNSPAWIIAALAVLAAGCVLVPIDELADPEQLDAALTRCAAKLIFTEHHRETCANSFRKHRTEVILVDDAGPSAPPPVGWRVQLPDAVVEIPDRTDGPALLSRTSGTTGSPKAFVLTHRNIATNVEALSGLDLVGPEDRALLPLPMHHAYPFVVGMLTTLTIGTAIVLPKDVSGPEVNRAMREADVTAVVGVPRLYEALLSALELRVKGYGRIARLLWRGTLTSLILLQRATGLRPGRVALAPIRRAVAPHLRLLVSGGAQLQRATEEQLEALGWIVLSGYGLAETASLFTGNLPNARRFGSAGRPLADGAIRIAAPDPQGVGEIELYGSSITSGYLDNPEADRAAFTADGWFRTGDLGLLDQHGFLFVTGRTKEILVLAGGKKVVPEELENVYGAAPAITEVAVIEDKGRLVALVRPDAERLRQRGTTNFRDAVRVSLGETAQGLPSYERLSGFALTDRPLPRTRLGKIRRFLLPDLYAQALAGGGAHISRPLTPAETTLLSNPTAADVLEVVR
jgi:long-chain acyl-CoA synthetase